MSHPSHSTPEYEFDSRYGPKTALRFPCSAGSTYTRCESTPLPAVCDSEPDAWAIFRANLTTHNSPDFAELRYQNFPIAVAHLLRDSRWAYYPAFGGWSYAPTRDEALDALEDALLARWKGRPNTLASLLIPTPEEY